MPFIPPHVTDHGECGSIEIVCACCFWCNSHFCFFVTWILILIWLVYTVFALMDHRQVEPVNPYRPTASPIMDNLISSHQFEVGQFEVILSVGRALVGVTLSLLMTKVCSKSFWNFPSSTCWGYHSSSLFSFLLLLYLVSLAKDLTCASSYDDFFLFFGAFVGIAVGIEFTSCQNHPWRNSLDRECTETNQYIQSCSIPTTLLPTKDLYLIF